MKKKSQLILSLAVLTLFLVACGTSPITESSTGFWDRIILYNLSQFIIWLSNLLGGSYGLGIIVFTIITRLIMIPLMHFQYKSTRKQAILQPEIKALREKYSARDRATQEMLQAEMNALYEREGINQYAGCLPLLIQLPVMMALYQAISRTDVLKTGHFLWINLGGVDTTFVLPILAAIFTFLSTWLSNKAMVEKNGAMTGMMYAMPVMIFFFAMYSPSGVALYWAVSNAYQVLQTYLLNNPFKIIAEREAGVQAKKDLEIKKRKALKKAQKKKK